MKAIFDQGPGAPCPAPFNMAAHVLARAGDTPGKTALSIVSPDGASDWSYGALRAAVLGTGTGLLCAGLAPGDVVLMRLGNTVDFPLAYLGAIAVGLVPAPTAAQLTAPEVARMVRALSPAAILHDARVPCPDDTGTPVIGTDALADMRTLPAADLDMGDPDRLAYIIHTSGTAGVPRAVGHAHRAIWARRMMFDGWYGLRPDDRLMHAGAFNWTYTLGTGLMDPWTVGATALIPAEGVAPDALPGLMRRHGATIFAAAPGVYRKVLAAHSRMDLPALRHGLAAGEKLSDTTRADWHAATGSAIYEAYGMSECSTFISGSPSEPAHPGTLGRPQTGRRVAIVDTGGTPVDIGAEGTIAVARRDPGLMLGYLGAPDDTAARMRGEWFLTGDQGAMDADGHVRYLGRADDMMNAGGFRVSPLEVESALHAHPGIDQVGVTDVEVKPDVRVIAAFYTGPRALDEAVLHAYAAERLARYKQPRAYVHLDALPTGANGKLLRRALREMFPKPGGGR